MNKKLETEAEHYAHNYFEMHETNHYKALKQGYIAGATSKYAEKQKLEFGMSVLNTAKDLDIQTVYFKLKQKLSEL